MRQDDSDDTQALMGLSSNGWTAPLSVVTHCVQLTLLQAVRIAHQTLDKPSEKTVMQIFQMMLDRTTFTSACQENDSMPVH
jgi:hypothetical protein